MGRQGIRVLCAALLLLTASCAASREIAPTPFPSLEPISDFLARLTPGPSPAHSASPSPSAGVSTGESTAAKAAPAATHHSSVSSPLHCPSGQVTADLEEVRSQDTGRSYRNGDKRWNVTASGTATNNASASVSSVHLAVTVHAPNEHPATVDVTVGQTIGPGSSAPWSTSFEYRSARQPSGEGSVAVTGWSWANSAQASCPS